jgi:hypothetical protein
VTKRGGFDASRPDGELRRSAAELSQRSVVQHRLRPEWTPVELVRRFADDYRKAGGTIETTGLGGSARQMSASVFHPSSGRPDCVAGLRGFELGYPCASHVFEIS